MIENKNIAFQSQNHLLIKVPVGYPKINTDKIRNTRVIASPGCYPSSILLGLAPVMASGGIEHSSITIHHGSDPYCEAGLTTCELSRLSASQSSIFFSEDECLSDECLLAMMQVMPIRKCSAASLTNSFRTYFENADFSEVLSEEGCASSQDGNYHYYSMDLSTDEHTGAVYIAVTAAPAESALLSQAV